MSFSLRFEGDGGKNEYVLGDLFAYRNFVIFVHLLNLFMVNDIMTAWIHTSSIE